MAKEFVKDTEQDVDDCFAEQVQAITEALDRATRLVRLTACALCLDLGEGYEATTAEDLVWIKKTQTKLPEKSLREVIDSTDVWKVVVDEVVRTATSTKKLQAELSRVTETFKGLHEGKIGWSCERLTALRESLVDMQTGLRAIMVEGINDLAHEVLTSRASTIVQSKTLPEGLHSREIEALLRCLDVFSQTEGIEELQKQLQAWADDHSQDMAFLDLRELATKARREGTVDLGTVAALLPRVSQSTSCKRTEATYHAILSLLVASFNAFLAEALCFKDLLAAASR